MKALLSHDQTAFWPRLCLRDEFWPRKKEGICCPNATVSGNIIIKVDSKLSYWGCCYKEEKGC